MTILHFLALMACFGNTVYDAFAQKDIPALRRHLETATSERDSLNAIYRLYPLVRESALLAELPSEPNTPTAPTLAVLSALWAFRMEEAPVFAKLTYAGRTVSLLNRARALDARDPFVLLVLGQSLLYRPAFAAGNPAHAAEVFAQLSDQITDEPGCGVSALEGRVWLWRALRAAGDDRAPALRDRLNAKPLPPLFAEMLADPPS